MAEAKVTVALDLLRVNYECAKCGTAYTERQYDRELMPFCGRCAGSLERVTMVVARREPAPSSGEPEDGA